MATILEHDLAAREAKVARDAVTTDDERIQLDQAWSHHFTAANLMRMAEKHRNDARVMRHAADFHESNGNIGLARQFHSLADKAEAAAPVCETRAEVWAGADHAVIAKIPVDAKPPKTRRE